MGPQHPSTHGVLRVVLTLEGETITGDRPIIGYLHRGVEKLGEIARYAQFTPWTDRTDYVAAPPNNLGISWRSRSCAASRRRNARSTGASSWPS